MELVERAKIDKAFDELSLGKTGLVDEAAAARVGHMVGVGPRKSSAAGQRRRATMESAWATVTGILISLTGTVRTPPSRNTTWSFVHPRSSG